MKVEIRLEELDPGELVEFVFEDEECLKRVEEMLGDMDLDVLIDTCGITRDDVGKMMEYLDGDEPDAALQV